VVVCDGFVGNISLKTSEGVAKMISHYMKEEFTKSLYNRLAGIIAMPVLKAFKHRIDPGRYNGASMLGLKGIVIKSHGGADIAAYANAIEIALLEVEKSVPQQISQHIEPILENMAV
jgi:phosphate acyltransferase